MAAVNRRLLLHGQYLLLLAIVRMKIAIKQKENT
jgi:hypothetical protein